MNRFQISDERTVNSDYVTARCKSLLQNHLFHCNDYQSLFTIFAFLSQRGIPFTMKHHAKKRAYTMAISVHCGGNKREVFSASNAEPHIACSLALMLAAEFTGA